MGAKLEGERRAPSIIEAFSNTDIRDPETLWDYPSVLSGMMLLCPVGCEGSS